MQGSFENYAYPWDHFLFHRQAQAPKPGNVQLTISCTHQAAFSLSLLFIFMCRVSYGKWLFCSLLRCSRRLDWIFRKLMFTLPKITFAWMFLSLMDGRQRWVLSMRMLSPRLFIASIMKVLYKFCVWILTVSSELFKGICQFATSMCISISTS